MCISRQQGATIHKSVIVAQKGIKGFHLSTRIDAGTTICDVRLERTNDLYTLLESLMGIKREDKRGMPMVFESEGIVAKNKSIPRICQVFKYAETLTMSDVDGIPVIEGIIVANGNDRYFVRASEDGVVLELRKIEKTVSARVPVVSQEIEFTFVDTRVPRVLKQAS